MDNSQTLNRRTLLAAGVSAALWAGMPRTARADVGRVSAATVAARQKFFGVANVDAKTGSVRKDRVILSWFGVTNFAMAVGGSVVLLDAWVPRGVYSNRVATNPTELASLSPSHIFIGHGHFDHAADAGFLAATSGATVVGTAAHCDQIASQAPAPIKTHALPIVSAGQQTSFSLTERIKVQVIGHPHSAVEAPTGGHAPLLPLPDVNPLLTHPPQLNDLLGFVAHQTDQEGGSLLYRFTIGGFSLLWNDSAGPLKSVPGLTETLQRLPRSTVQVGAIQGFGQYTNGLRDPVDYVRAIRPSIFVPCHHDNWTPPLSSPAAGYERPLRTALEAIPAATRPEVRFLTDPADYVRPDRLTFMI